MTNPRQIGKVVLISLAMTTVFIHPRVVIGQSAPVVQAGGTSSGSAAEGWRAVERAETEWARARVRVDKETFDQMLAPDFYAQLPNKRVSREEFIQRISKISSDAKLTRFDNRVLTLHQEGDTWVGLIEEKLEYETQDANGKKTAYYLAITRDAWKKFGDQWKALFSEVVDMQGWNGEPPPIKGW